MGYPVFASGDVLNASDMNAVGLWRVTTCTVTSVGGTAATASNGVITIGTGNTSVTVNNAFSADYDNYRIMLTNSTNSTGANMSIQLSGITTSVYATAGTFYTFGSATVGGFGPAATTSFTFGPGNAGMTTAVIEIISPFASRRKAMISNGISDGATYLFNGHCSSTASASGFVILPASGSMTGGTIRVYGYRN